MNEITNPSRCDDAIKRDLELLASREHLTRLVRILSARHSTASTAEVEDALSDATLQLLDRQAADRSALRHQGLESTQALLLVTAQRRLIDSGKVHSGRMTSTYGLEIENADPSGQILSQLSDSGADPALEFDRLHGTLEVRNLLARLPRKQRLAIAAHEDGARTHAEVGELLGVSSNAVKHLLNRAYEQLRMWVSKKRDGRCEPIHTSAIVAFAAGTADAQQESIATTHMAVCSHCKSTYAEMRRQARDIAAFTPIIPLGFLSVLGAKIKGAAVVLGGVFKSGGAAAPGHDGGVVAATAGGSAAAAGGGGAASSGLLTAGGILGSKAAVTACIAVTAATGTCAAVFGPEIVKSSEPTKSEQKAEAPSDPTVIAPAPPEGTGTLPEPAPVEVPAEPKKTERTSEPKKESAAPQAPESASSVPEQGDSGWGFDEGSSSGADAAPADPAPEPSAPSNSSPANDAPSGGFGFQ